jgi:NTP pyrophosphatase (non-canonical NTP hydrolase)
MTRPSYREIEIDVIRWAEARRIIPNASPQSQLNKCLEELAELFKAESTNDLPKIKDGVGDVMVCLINYCALKDIDLVDCLALAYYEIKDRKGTLLPDGTFVKEKAPPSALTDADRARILLLSIVAGCKANGRTPSADHLVEALEGALHYLTPTA